MTYSSNSMWGRPRARLSETDLVRKGGKLAPTTFWWRVPQFPCHLGASPVGIAATASPRQDRLATQRNFSSSFRRLTRRHIANDAHRSLAALAVFTMMMVGCGEDSRMIRGGLRVAEVGRSYPFQQVDRTPWAIPKLFEVPGYDTEWGALDEHASEDQTQSESPEQMVDEPPTALCGNAVVEEGEACDLGNENGLWDRGRSLGALCTLTCQDPVWRGDLYLEEISHRRLESLWVIDGDVHLDAHLPWGLIWRSLREIRGDIHFHHDSPVIHIDFPFLAQLTGSLVLNAFTAPQLESVQAPLLLRIEGDLQIGGHENIEALEFDQLTHVGGDAVINENDLLEILHLPVLQRVENDFRVTDNPLLCEPWEMFEDWQWVSVYGDMELVRSNNCPFVIAQEN